VLRLAPPLVVTESDIEQGLAMLRRAAEACTGKTQAAAQ